MPEFDPNFDEVGEEVQEALPEGLRPTPPCPPLPLLLAHREGVLPEEAASAISGHLQHCGLCRALLADLEHLPQPGLSERERERLRGSLPIPSPARSGKWRWYAGFAAAAAVLLIGVFFALRPTSIAPAPAAQAIQTAAPQPATPKPEPPRIEVAKLDPPLELAPGLVLRGSAPSDQPSASQLAPAFEAYGANRYPLAAERFRLLAKRFPRADVPLLYLGVSQLMMQDDQAALVSLARADQFAAGSRKDAASWYHAVAAVQTHSPDASALLHDLCHRNKSTYAQQACALEESR